MHDNYYNHHAASILGSSSTVVLDTFTFTCSSSLIYYLFVTILLDNKLPIYYIYLSKKRKNRVRSHTELFAASP